MCFIFGLCRGAEGLRHLRLQTRHSLAIRGACSTPRCALHWIVLYTELCFTPSCAFHQVVLCIEFCLVLSATEQIQEVEPARNKGRFTVCQRHIWISLRWARPLPVATECPTQRSDSCSWTARRPDWGIVGERPIVLFKHQHTTLDKEIAKWCQWCHSHTVLVWQGFGQTSGSI